MSKEELKKRFKRNQRKIDNKKTSKEERKELIEENKKLLYLIESKTYNA